jgi:hypothetical protein
MGTTREDHSADSADLVERARAGDESALNEVYSRYRERLRRMVDIRLDLRVRARVDASDVVQEAYLDVTKRLPDYLRDMSKMASVPAYFGLHDGLRLICIWFAFDLGATRLPLSCFCV